MVIKNGLLSLVSLISVTVAVFGQEVVNRNIATLWVFLGITLYFCLAALCIKSMLGVKVTVIQIIFLMSLLSSTILCMAAELKVLTVIDITAAKMIWMFILISMPVIGIWGGGKSAQEESTLKRRKLSTKTAEKLEE